MYLSPFPVLITGLLDRHLAPRAARLEDVRSMLDDLAKRRQLREFIGRRRQQQTILGVVNFWRSCLREQEAAAQSRDVTVKLAPLFQAYTRLRVSSDVLDATRKRLGVSRNAAHNSIKRQLSLLASWGMVEELEDINAPD